MREKYISPKIEFATSSNDIVATSSFVETERIPLSAAQTYTELDVGMENPAATNYNVQN